MEANPIIVLSEPWGQEPCRDSGARLPSHPANWGKLREEDKHKCCLLPHSRQLPADTEESKRVSELARSRHQEEKDAKHSERDVKVGPAEG